VDFKRRLTGAVDEGVAVKVIDSTLATLLKYRSDIGMVGMERATATLIEAYTQKKRIQFYGVGDSGGVAQDAQHKFFRLVINTVACSDSHFQIVSASMLQPAIVWSSFPTIAPPRRSV